VEPLTDEELQFLLSAVEMARTGETDQLAALLDAGLPVNLTNAAGDSLLILAAYHGHSRIVSMLLERGADSARINDRGQSALAAAAFRRSEQNVRALLEAGADPDLGNPSARQITAFFELDDMRELLPPTRRCD
jgi:ankyrin repeat protein